jgi:Tol biopolymer transport system component
MPATTAELSPHALYAAVGIGSSLVALAPGERRAWTHPTGGSVAAAAWSPDGLKIAYVVNRHGAYDLRLIEGDGDHDRLLARRVAAVKPWWRRDSLALHYLLASGRRATLDFARGRRILGAVTSLPPAAASASSRLGREVAVATRSSRRIVELRIVRVPGPTPNRVLLRVPAGRTPLSVSWR